MPAPTGGFKRSSALGVFACRVEESLTSTCAPEPMPKVQ